MRQRSRTVLGIVVALDLIAFAYLGPDVQGMLARTRRDAWESSRDFALLHGEARASAEQRLDRVLEHEGCEPIQLSTKHYCGIAGEQIRTSCRTGPDYFEVTATHRGPDGEVDTWDDVAAVERRPMAAPPGTRCLRRLARWHQLIDAWIERPATEHEPDTLADQIRTLRKRVPACE